VSVHHRLKLPLSERDVRELALGDTVSLDGDIVVTIGLPTHQRIAEYLRAGRPLPLDLHNAAFLHLSCLNTEGVDGPEALYLGVTTSTRFDAFMPSFIRAFNLRLVGGKGGLDMESVRAMREVGCAYLSFLGGSTPLLSQSLRRVADVQWTYLISQFRLVKLSVEDLGPATVAIDAHGHSLYENLRRDALERRTGIVAELNAGRMNTAPAGATSQPEDSERGTQ
jgi:fumarate hydratase subunit beta